MPPHIVREIAARHPRRPTTWFRRIPGPGEPEPEVWTAPRRRAEEGSGGGSSGGGGSAAASGAGGMSTEAAAAAAAAGEAPAVEATPATVATEIPPAGGGDADAQLAEPTPSPVGSGMEVEADAETLQPERAAPFLPAPAARPISVSPDAVSTSPLAAFDAAAPAAATGFGIAAPPPPAAADIDMA